VLASMLYLDSIDNTKKILLYINGPGGDVRTLQHHAWTYVGLSTFMLLLLFFLGEKIGGHKSVTWKQHKHQEFEKKI
jgi:hypothetical protein